MIVESDVYWRKIRYDSISQVTVCKHLNKLTTRVEQKISDQLPPKFARVFNGWSTGDTHYVSWYGSFPSMNKNGFKMALLGFSPFEDELCQSADFHHQYLEFVLGFHGKSWENIVAVIGDNCSCNREFKIHFGTVMLGCTIHWSKLYVKDVTIFERFEICKCTS